MGKAQEDFEAALLAAGTSLGAFSPQVAQGRAEPGAEYPKMLYSSEPPFQLVVDSREAETEAQAAGWGKHESTVKKELLDAKQEPGSA